MKKCLILPYFGPFNNYFDLWLNSAEYNDDIDWLIFTDNELKRNVASNIKWVKMSFDDLKCLFKSKLEINISLNKPYKLCDYKPLYGYLFSDYLQDYEFWGYCDCDVIFGKINDFLTNDIFENYDKILRTGHLSFIRNKKEINENFRNYSNYKIFLTSPLSYAYDEVVFGYHDGFAGEMLKSGFKFYNSYEYIADIDFRYPNFNIVNSNYKNVFFSYENGHTFMFYEENKTLIKKEIMYLHLQKRKMINKVTSNDKNFLVVPNEIRLSGTKNVTIDLLPSIKENNYDFKKEKIELLKMDIKRFLHEPNKLKSLKYRFRRNK